MWGAGDLDVEPTSATSVTGHTVPPGRPAGEMFDGEVDELVDKLVEKLAEGKFV